VTSSWTGNDARVGDRGNVARSAVDLAMFPGPDEDHFGGFLGNVREWDVSPEFTAYLDGFYWVVPG
jgi:hypothetical protein